MPILINGEWWERITPPWITGYKPVSTYKRVPKPVISLQKFDNISKKGKLKMTNRIITKTEATPTQIEAFKARTNKKDSFTRWFQKHGSI